MLQRIACVRCRLEALWTDEPECFLATVCRDRRRCGASFLDEEFRKLPLAACPVTAATAEEAAEA